MFCYFNKKSGGTEFYPSFMLLIGDALDSRNRTLAVMAIGQDESNVAPQNGAHERRNWLEMMWLVISSYDYLCNCSR